MHLSVCSNIIYNCQDKTWKQLKCPLTDEWDTHTHTHTRTHTHTNRKITAGNQNDVREKRIINITQSHGYICTQHTS